jgi:Flp pilus assembly protein TadG
MIKRRTRDRHGAAIVEMAFIVPVCLMFMFAIFEYARFVFARQVLENAARSGARVAVVTPTSYITTAQANAQVDAAVTQALANVPLQNATWTAWQADSSGNNVGAWTSTPFGQNLVVQVEGDLPLMFPTLGLLWYTGSTQFIKGDTPNSIHFKVKVMMRGEAN